MAGDMERLADFPPEATSAAWLLGEADGPLEATPERVARLRAFAFERWKERASQFLHPEPEDLSNACKFNALLVKAVLGGTVRGSYDHLYNVVAGEVVDLSEGAADVRAMAAPYRHDASHFEDNATLYEQLDSCLPRVARWAGAFVALEAALAPGRPGPR